MTRYGYFLSSEEYDPVGLIQQAKMAEQAGFEALWISDHFHPWLDEQGNSSFVWSVIGAISQVTDLPITTAVTCPTTRIHPAIVAQAAATAGLLTGGKFNLGVGTGEALNEHVTGAQWPAAEVRREMLEEAVGIISARIADGYICIGPEADLVKLFRDQGGGSKPVQGGLKGCWAPDAAAARATLRQLWPNDFIPGESAQLLPLPRHFRQLAPLVTDDMVTAPAGPDPEPYLEALRSFEQADFDEVYLQQVGGNLEGAFEFFATEVLPRARGN